MGARLRAQVHNGLPSRVHVVATVQLLHAQGVFRQLGSPHTLQHHVWAQHAYDFASHGTKVQRHNLVREGNEMSASVHLLAESQQCNYNCTHRQGRATYCLIPYMNGPAPNDEGDATAKWLGHVSPRNQILQPQRDPRTRSRTSRQARCT
jgi:hypothetical protein